MTEARILAGGTPEDRVALVLDPAPPRGPRILWFGDWDGPDGDRIETTPLPAQRWGARLDDPLALTLVPAAGTGHPGPPGLECRTATGVPAFLPDRVEHRFETDAWVVEQTDAVSSVRVITRLELDRPTGALCVTTRIRNEGPEPLAVDWLSAATVPLPDWCEEVEHVAGDWCGEFRRQRTRPGEGSWLQETREGRSSHRSPPHCILQEAGIGPRTGRAIAVEFAWSGDHRMRLDRLPDGTRVLQAGVLLAPGELVLEPGAVHAAPPVWLVCSRRGRDGLAARTHDLCRRRVLPAVGMRRPRPVHLNTWEAVWFDQDPERLIGLAETAADLGVERFVLDDGWFAGRIDDRRALGDWQVDPVRWPEGLEPLIDRVRSLGMEFGLWVEPEMVSDDSDLARAHPEMDPGAGRCGATAADGSQSAGPRPEPAGGGGTSVRGPRRPALPARHRLPQMGSQSHPDRSGGGRRAGSPAPDPGGAPAAGPAADAASAGGDRDLRLRRRPGRLGHARPDPPGLDQRLQRSGVPGPDHGGRGSASAAGGGRLCTWVRNGPGSRAGSPDSTSGPRWACSAPSAWSWIRPCFPGRSEAG
ncbi:MAG: alpha-galactosidase [Gammaproteobacteria bacterium]|nr:alpha-galactosidase [Gammaproteobacteria bacterium]